MAGFDKHLHCARCRDKIKRDDPCVSKKRCSFCDILSPEQKLQIYTPSYQKKKEKRQQKSIMTDKSAENVPETLVDPSLVSVVGVVSADSKAMKSPTNIGKSKKKHSTPVKKSSSTDSKLEAMDQKWSERFSRLEVLFSSKARRKSSQEPLPVGGIASADKQKFNRTSHKSKIFGVLQFLVPKANNKWRPIIDRSNLNKFLKVEKFKMETPETIWTSLQTGEWVTSIDFKDAYFHIPIQNQSRKYLRFHVQGKTFQFKVLPFGLTTAPLVFTVVAKEVKLMAL